MPDLTKCPFCGDIKNVLNRDPRKTEFACGTFTTGGKPWQSTDCQFSVAQARLDALKQLAAEQCGHSPTATQDPLEAIRRELARLRAENALLEHQTDCEFCCVYTSQCEEYGRLLAIVESQRAFPDS